VNVHNLLVDYVHSEQNVLVADVIVLNLVNGYLKSETFIVLVKTQELPRKIANLTPRRPNNDCGDDRQVLGR